MTVTDNTSATMAATAKKRDVEEMICIYLKMSELERAKMLGYAQGIESMTGKMDMQRAV